MYDGIHVLKFPSYIPFMHTAAQAFTPFYAPIHAIIHTPSHAPIHASIHNLLCTYSCNHPHTFSCTLPCILRALPQQLQSLRDQLKAKACEVCKENEILNQEFEELRCENKCLKCKIKELEEEGGCLKAIADNIRQKVGGGGLDPSESSRVSPGLGSISGNLIKEQMPCLVLK